MTFCSYPAVFEDMPVTRRHPLKRKVGLVPQHANNSQVEALQRLPPHPKPNDKARDMNGFTGAAGKRRGFAKAVCISETNVRRKFSRDLITKPNSTVEIRQAGPNATCRISFVVEIHFDLRLKDEALYKV